MFTSSNFLLSPEKEKHEVRIELFNKNDMYVYGKRVTAYTKDKEKIRISHVDGKFYNFSDSWYIVMNDELVEVWTFAEESDE